MPLTLSEIAETPALLTSPITLASGDSLVLRPLTHSDVVPFATFLECLSPETRHFSTFVGYDIEAAQELCAAIARYDKLRLVVKAGTRIVGLLEFSMDVPAGDLDRYQGYGIALDAETTCRFGPTLADDYQERGLGSLLFPYVADIARQFGKPRIILWGGVLADNARAIHYYAKCGFRVVGKFIESEGLACLDMLFEPTA